MGHICSKVSITSIAPGNSPSLRKGPIDAPGSKDGNSGGGSVFSGPAKEFLQPFASNYSHRGDSTAWQFVRQASMIHTYIEVPFAEWIEMKMEQLHEEELQRLLMIFRQQVQLERQHYLLYPHHNAKRGLLGMFSGNASTTSNKGNTNTSTALNINTQTHTNTADSIADVDAPSTPTGSVKRSPSKRGGNLARAYSQRTADSAAELSSVGGGDSEAWQAGHNASEIDGVGHIWRRLSLHTEKSLFVMFPHLYTATGNLHIDFNSTEEELAFVSHEAHYTVWVNWKNIVFTQLADLQEEQQSQLFQRGVSQLEGNQLYQIFFLLDIIQGYHILLEHAVKYNGSMQKLSAAQWPKRGEDVIFQDFVALVSILMHGKVEDWLVVLLLTFAQLDIEHFQPPAASQNHHPSSSSTTSQNTTNAHSPVWEYILFDEQQALSIVVHMVLLWLQPTQGNSRIHLLPKHRYFQLALQLLSYAGQNPVTVPGQKHSLASLLRMITMDGDDLFEAVNGQNSLGVASSTPTSKLWLLFIEFMQSLDADSMRTVFYPLLYDLSQNPFEYGRKVMDEYHLSPAIEQLTRNALLFHRFNYSLHATSATTTALTSLGSAQPVLQGKKTYTKKLAASTKLLLSSIDKQLLMTFEEMTEAYKLLLSATVSCVDAAGGIQAVESCSQDAKNSDSSVEMFVIEAGWWAQWCAFMQLTPIYGSSTMQLISHEEEDGEAGMAHSLVNEVSDIIANDALDCVLLGLRCNRTARLIAFHSEEYVSSLFEEFFHNPLQHVAYERLPNLNNATLLVEPMPGFYQLMPSSVLQPKCSSGNQAAGKELIALPFAVGRMLYDYYDPSARIIPPAVFKATLLYYNKEISGDSLVTQDKLDGNAPLLNAFVNNFSSSTHAICPELLLYRDHNPHGDVQQDSASYARYIPNVSPLHDASCNTNSAVSNRPSSSSGMFNTSLPIYFCTDLGIATNQPVDIAYVAYNIAYATLRSGHFDVRYLQPATHQHFHVAVQSSVEQYCCHLLAKYYQPNPTSTSSEDPTTADVSSTHRLWGLVHLSQYTAMLRRDAAVSCMAFTKDYCWVLLSPQDCLLSLLYPTASSAMSASSPNSSAKVSAKVSVSILGFMLENAVVHHNHGTAVQWPSERILQNILYRRIEVAAPKTGTDKDLVLEDVEDTDGEQADSQPLLKVGMRLDYLTEEQAYGQGVLTHIDRNTTDLHTVVYEEFYMQSQGDVVLTLQDCITQKAVHFPMKSLRLLLAGTITTAFQPHNTIYTEIDFSKTRIMPTGRSIDAQFEQVVFSTALSKTECEVNYETAFGLFAGLSPSFPEQEGEPDHSSSVQETSEVFVATEQPPEFASTRKISTITEADGEEEEEEEIEEHSASKRTASDKSSSSKRAAAKAMLTPIRSASPPALILAHDVYRVLSQSYVAFAHLAITQYSCQLRDGSTSQLDSSHHHLPMLYFGSGGIAQAKYALYVLGIQLLEYDPQPATQAAADDASTNAGSSITNSVRQSKAVAEADDAASLASQSRHGNNNQEASVEMASTGNASSSLTKPMGTSSRIISLPRHRSMSFDKQGNNTTTALPKQYERWGIIGLNNMGNTCFFSSAMQCLLHHPSIVASMISYVYMPYTNITSKLGSKGKVLEEFAKFVQAVYRSHSSSTVVHSRGTGSGPGQRSLSSAASTPQVFASFPALSPTSLWKAFQAHKVQFNGQDQQDAQEFLAELLDTLHEDTKFQSRYVSLRKERLMAKLGTLEPLVAAQDGSPNAAAAGNGNGEQQVSNPTVRLQPHQILRTYQQLLQESAVAWFDHSRQHHSIISATCTGMLCTNVVCNNCRAVSKKFEPFNMLSLPLPALHGGGHHGAGHGSSVSSSLQGNYQVNVVLSFVRKLPRMLYLFQVQCWLQHVIRHAKTLQHKDDLVARLRDLWQQFTDQQQANAVPQRQVFRIAFTVNATQNVEEIKRLGLQAYFDSMQRDVHLDASSSRKDDELALLLQNTTLILGHEEETYRIRKILDNKDTIQGIVEEVPAAVDVANDNSMELLLVENNKDLIFIGKLSARRLSQDVHEDFHVQWMDKLQDVMFQTALTGADDALTALVQDSLDLMASLLQDRVLVRDADIEADPEKHVWYYTDAQEYQLYTCDAGQTLSILPDNPLYAWGFLGSQGRLICDVDNIYAPPAPASAQPPPHANTSPGIKKKNKPNQSLQPTLQMRVPSHIPQSPATRWPKTLWDFELFDRVDALDHKGHWYPGSVVQQVYSTSSGVGQAPVHPKHQPSVQLNKKMHAVYTATKPAADVVSKMTERDLRYYKCFIRVHFDHFSHTWDEWYDEEDYAKGNLQPVYSKTSRKLKIFDVQIIQRKLYYYQDEEDGENASVKQSLGKMEVLPSPHIVQVESYRSTVHGYQHIVEQMLRSLSSDDWQHLVEAAGDANPHQMLASLAEKLPFRVRVLNMQNMHAAPLTTDFVEAQAVTALAASAASTTASKILSRLPPGGKGKELFLQYKTWEGMSFPCQEPRRPMANIFHNKLVVSVDWEYLVVSEDEVLARAGLVGNVAHSFPSNDDGEYILPLHLLDSKATIPKVLSPVVYASDHASYTEYQVKTMKNQRLASNPSSTTGSVGKSLDQRVGLTIEQVLQDYMASEVIPDYHCDHCSSSSSTNKTHSSTTLLANKGTLYTSISALPDTLILHLKRLVINATGGSKIRTLVKFPMEGLDMHSFTLEHFSRQRYRDDMVTEGYLDELPDLAAIANLLSAEDGQVVYDLFGVVNHMGGMFGGHYTAYVLCEDVSYATTSSSTATMGHGPAELRMREYLTQMGVSNQPVAKAGATSVLSPAQLSTSIPFLQSPTQELGNSNKRWYKFDDEFVHDLNYPTGYAGYPSSSNNAAGSQPAGNVEQNIVSESAYILFYQRRNLSVRHMLPFI